MSSTKSSPRRIEKVSSDNAVIGFDLLSNLTYMSVLSMGDLPRDQVLDRCSRQPLKTAIFFDYAYILTKRLGFEYTQALQMLSEKAKASSVKSLLLRFAAAVSSGESEREFGAQEAKIEAERYTNVYERSVENLRKWTDAYAAILVSVTLIMVVSLVSTMMGSLSQSFVVVMGATLFVITGIGVYVICKVSPVERTTYDTPQGCTKVRRKARLLLACLLPIAIIAAILIAPRFGVLGGASVVFVLLGAFLLPSGFFSWKDETMVAKLDSEFPTFLRTVGNVASSSGVTLSEALRRIDTRSLGSLESHVNRLRIRLSAGIPTQECWQKFREETGSELANRTTHMLVDGSELGGRPAEAGQLCSNFALTVTQLRAKRQLTASTFSFLVLPMHATMTFILVFVLEIISNFNTTLGAVSGQISSGEPVELAGNTQYPPGMAIPSTDSIASGMEIFGAQDLSLVTYVILFVIVILTGANSLAPNFAAGGSNLKVVSYLSFMSIISGSVLGIVPLLASMLFSI